MAVDDKARHAAQKAGGRIEEATGKITDDEKLEAKGKVRQAKGHLGDAAEEAKGAARKAKDRLTD
jgi:uncharacterized protein YjbJ (UPF0337 family)